MVLITCRCWRQNGRVVGLVLKFEGESLERHLTYGEIADLQAEEEE